MRPESRARSLELLDSLGAFPRTSLEETAWRVVRQGRDPLHCHPSSGRWDLGRSDVLYTSLTPDGARAEVYFHLSRQPVFPSSAFSISELRVVLHAVLRLETAELARLGVTSEDYQGVLPGRTQEIGDAAAFLGFDGIVSPSARWKGHNLTVLCDNAEPGSTRLVGSQVVDWQTWRTSRK